MYGRVPRQSDIEHNSYARRTSRRSGLRMASEAVLEQARRPSGKVGFDIQSDSCGGSLTYFVRRYAAVGNEPSEILRRCSMNVELHLDPFILVHLGTISCSPLITSICSSQTLVHP